MPFLPNGKHLNIPARIFPGTLPLNCEWTQLSSSLEWCDYSSSLESVSKSFSQQTGWPLNSRWFHFWADFTSNWLSNYPKRKKPRNQTELNSKFFQFPILHRCRVSLGGWHGKRRVCLLGNRVISDHIRPRIRFWSRRSEAGRPKIIHAFRQSSVDFPILASCKPFRNVIWRKYNSQTVAKQNPKVLVIQHGTSFAVSSLEWESNHRPENRGSE